MSKRIEKCLRKALLLNGKMSDELFEFELEENIGDWIQSIHEDKNQFVFVMTENNGDVHGIDNQQRRGICK
jgi:alpha-galactosidase/6-phospho-beta-glucosidase family protein